MLFSPAVQVMGVKRVFDEEDFQELSFKQAKRVDCEDKLAQFAENSPHYVTSPNIDLQGTICHFTYHVCSFILSKMVFIFDIPLLGSLFMTCCFLVCRGYVSSFLL